MKDTLTVIKNIGNQYQGINIRESIVEYMKQRIKSLIWKTRKQKTSHQNSQKKKEYKKLRTV